VKEMWKDIKDFEGLYQVSSLGNIKNIKTNRVFNGYIQNTGYPTVTLKNKKYSIHRLVALAFIDNPLQKPQVNHIDSDRTNNKVENLEWCTHSENMQHAFKVGAMDNAIKKLIKNKIRAKKVAQYDLSDNLIAIHKGSVDITNKLKKEGIKISHRNVRKVCQGERHKAGGFVWKYLD
jgi:uncharacterized FAD-dependent dehydrogenase